MCFQILFIDIFYLPEHALSVQIYSIFVRYFSELQGLSSDIIPPPPDIQPIIDKMANYVAKNGVDFEMTVKNKGDQRFEFLNSWHVHNAYYEYKKQLYEKEMAAENVKVTITTTTQNEAGQTVVTKTSTTLGKVAPKGKCPRHSLSQLGILAKMAILSISIFFHLNTIPIA